MNAKKPYYKSDGNKRKPLPYHLKNGKKPLVIYVLDEQQELGAFLRWKNKENQKENKDESRNG